MITLDKKLVRKAPTIESKRLFMRPFKMDDAKLMVESGWLHRKTKKPLKTIEESKKYLKNILAEDQGYYLAVFLKDNTLVGRLDLDHLNWYGDMIGEIGYSFLEKHRGNGYATEATNCFVDYLFRKVKLHKVTADTDPGNFASQKVLYKVGFTLEGIFRDKYYDKNLKKWVDEYNWGLKRDEWMKKHKKQIYKIKK